MTDLAILHELAPVQLRAYREDRYDGGGFGITLTDLAEEDRAITLRIYQATQGLYEAWLPLRGTGDFSLLRGHLGPFAEEGFVAAAQSLGTATAARGGMPPAMRKVIHDIRGGGLSLLIGTAAMVDHLAGDDPLLRACVLTARDHAKIMRSLLADIDPEVRAADEATRTHDVHGFVTKWDQSALRVQGKPVLVSVRCLYDGSVTARCLETSSIDRVVYNFINNAARFTADGRVALTIFPVENNLLRWVVSNAVTRDQSEWLATATGGDLKKLFRGGLTRGGQGVGLTNCADIVAASFGVTTPEEAVEKGYLGAKVVDHQYHAWFHWPAYVPPSVA